VSRRRQRGAVSVELALGLPVLVLIILGGVHFGLVLKTRAQLGDATNHAARAAGIARTANAAQVQATVQSRLGAASGCTNLVVTAVSAQDVLGGRRNEVTSRCTVATGIGGALLGFLGAADISVRASMPY